MANREKQWYEETPELLTVEKAAMEMVARDDNKTFRFLQDGRACWYIKFKSRLSGRKYNVKLVYPTDHPSKREISGIRAYLIEPTYETLVDELNKTSGSDYENLPYTFRDGEGMALSVCKSTWSFNKVSDGIISAASVLEATKEWIAFYEMGVANHGVGFYRFSTVNPDAQKDACIEYYGAPAVNFFYEKTEDKENE